MAVTLKEAPEGATLQVSGSLTMPVAADFHNGLKGALELGSRLCLDLADVVEVDLTGLQLILSAQRTFSQQGIDFRIADPAGVARTARDAAGFPGLEE